MKIKQIHIKGFKSFGNRTTIRFGEGVSCIVGPNGCGKSNIVDAFLWVMGETAPSLLRGSSMEELIFAGAGKQPASGIAEVSLIMELPQKASIEEAKAQEAKAQEAKAQEVKAQEAKSQKEKSQEESLKQQAQSQKENTQTKFPYPYSSEIMLTRRLDRAGKSEYFINSRLCRLKDVQEIFMDTGVGVHGFSFIEQGAVESFISAKPEQKRTLIESAAGVSKFRSRKKEAERKLDLTEVNLNRLKDILSQQSTQLSKLRKQSENAEQFRDIKNQVQDKDIKISVWDKRQIQQERESILHCIKEKQKENKSRKKSLEQARIRSEDREKVYQKNKTKLDTLLKSMESIKLEFFSLEKDLASLRASIQVNKQNLYSHKSMHTYRQNRKGLLLQIEESKNQIIHLEKKQKDLYKKWEDSEKEYKKSYKICSSLSSKKQFLKTEIINYQHQSDLSQERVQSLTEKIKDAHLREEDRKKLLEQKTQTAKKLKSKKNLLSESLEKKKQLSFNVTNSVQELRKRVQSLKTDIQSQEESLKEAEMKASALHSEWSSLKKWAEHKSLREKGMQFILQSSEWKNTFIETAKSFRLSSPILEKAVSSFMDMRLKSLFCPDEVSLLQALEELKKENQGACRFVGLFAFKDFTKYQASSELLKKETGFKFFLKDRAEGNADLIKVLFSNTVVVEDIETALRLKRKYSSWHFITLKGEVLTEDGDLIGGGFPEDNTKMNILSYQRALEELPLRLKHEREQINALKANLKKTNTLFHKNSNSLLELNKEGGDFQISILEVNKDLESLNKDQDRLISEISNIQKEILQWQNQVQELQKKRSAILDQKSSTLALSDLNKNLEKVLNQFEKEEQETKKWLDQKDKLWKDLAECEKELATIKEKNIILTQSLEQGEQNEKQVLSHSLEKKTLIQNYENQLKQKEKQKQICQQEMEQKQKYINSLKQEQETLREQISTDQSFVIKCQETFTVEESSINDLKLKSESLLLKESSLVERIQEKYHLENFDSISIETHLEEFDRESEEQELKKLNNKLARIGEVNLLALKEYEELLKENQFYQKQYEDLCISKDKLWKAISRIESFCSKKFKEVFDEVNSCFSRVWPALFDGGHAELVLTKEPEKGMDIIVQPPGKKVQSMSLLSGGEKAMTAVAVIFSIFLVKPPPFCILDEVDAPLDDINIIRFNSLLAEMAKVSQVVLITHNKHTMKECSQLYGVTMEEQGISKVISLNMQFLDQGVVQ